MYSDAFRSNLILSERGTITFLSQQRKGVLLLSMPILEQERGFIGLRRFGEPPIFLTNCSEAARTSSSVTGGPKLKNVFICRHVGLTSDLNAHAVDCFIGVRDYLTNPVTDEHQG